VNSSDRADLPRTLSEFLDYAFQKGVTVWTDNGRLRYRAPKGTLTSGDIERLAESREQIISLLQTAKRVDEIDPSLGRGPRQRRAPLTFSQLQHWNLYRLRERRAMRHIAIAMSLRGPLSIDALRDSLIELVRLQDALRTRIIACDGGPVQEIDDSRGCPLEVHDLTGIPVAGRETAVNRMIAELILEPIDIAVGPLFAVRVLKVSDRENVLVVAIEHVVSDMFSMNIVLRYLFTAYVQALKGQVLSLPPVRTQFAEYALWQRAMHSSWIERHGSYWNERVNRWRRLRFPMGPTEGAVGWGVVEVPIQIGLIAELREWSLIRRTTIVMTVFTAYVGLVLRWCDVSEAVIQYQTDGRRSLKTDNTVGYFASALYLQIDIGERDSFIDLLTRVTEEYCRAYEHADSFYLQAQQPRPDFTRTTCFNWVPADMEIDLSGLVGSADALECSPFPTGSPTLEHLEIDAEPFVVVSDKVDGSLASVYFPLSRFSVHTMERFGRNFVAFIRELLTEPGRRVSEINLVQ
jgi:hypothetical protein